MASSVINTVSNYELNVQKCNSLLTSKLLKPLDDALRCHICFEYFTNCMMTKCSHNYCSVCIRRYMAYKSQCPTCFKVASEPELQNNRLIDEILRIYKKIRETVQIPAEIVKEPILEQPSVSQSHDEKDYQKPLTSEKSPCRKSSTKSSSSVQEDATSDEVSCPVCYNTVSSERINIHLDTCLKQTEERIQRKFLPKLVYHLLSDKDIRKKLKEHGLSTSGDRQTLIKRLKNFIILYNANCDSLNPKPVSDLIYEIEKQELEERLNSFQKNTQVNKKSDESEIERQHESYVREHQSQFKELIRDVQQRVLDKHETKECGDIEVKQETKECDEVEESLSSQIVDAAGNIIGESSLRIGEPDIGSVKIKQEVEDLISTEIFLRQSFSQTESTAKNSREKKHTESKGAPTVKIKEEESPSLLDNLPNPELLATDSQPSSIDDFEAGKIPSQMYRKRKNIKRLSNQRKK